MAIQRYADDVLVRGGRLLGTNNAISTIRNGIANNTIATSVRVTTEAERLDIIAGQQYGDGRLWWVIAAASGIGWWLQVPAGTRVVIPLSIGAIEDLL